MNAERLHAIAKALQRDMDSTSIVSALQKVANTLNNLASQPGHLDFQNQVSVAINELNETLSLSEVNNFSPTWRQSLEEMNISGLIGLELKDRVEIVISKNQMTPSVAATEVAILNKKVHALKSHIDQLVSNFEYFEIGAEDLEAGECEIGVLIPREFVSNRLDKFSDELDELNKIFGCFSELAIGSRPSFEIKTISSSDLSIYLDTLPAVGACIAISLERIIGLYKQLLEIRKLQGELKKQGLAEKNLKGIEDHSNQLMDSGIDALVKELLAEHKGKVEAGRSHELSIELKYSLKKIANRIDKGFNIDVRMQEPDGPEENDADVKETANYEKIRDASAGMQFLKLDGEPILNLSEEKPVRTAKKID